MTLIAASIFVRSPEDVADALERARTAVAKGANLIEWRADSIGTDQAAIAAMLEIIRTSPASGIVTCRSTSEGGEFEGTDAELADFLSELGRADNPPHYIDLELARFRDNDAVWPAALNLGDEDAAPSLILSMHADKGRPRDLLQRVAAMIDEPACSVAKVVWTARSLRDNLEAFDLLSEQPKPTIALCMGPFGLMSRVLAPKFGGFITFAAVERGEESAPGQPTIDDLRRLYRFDSIGPETGVYGVIGWPIEHSLGPLLHNTGFDDVGFDGVYLPMPVPPESVHFKATIGAFVDHPRLGFRGASVTLPHKEHLLRFVEERGGRIDLSSRIAGAANTLLVGTTGAVVCRNTDVPAIVESLAEALNIDPEGLKGVRVAVLGAGGVARAALAGLIQHDADVVIFNRTRERAETLVEDLAHRAQSIESKSTIALGEPGGLATETFDVLINCTSIGMQGGPLPDATPIDVLSGGEASIDESVTVFDTVYTPSRTPLIAEAELRGARVVLGIDLLIRQAALQFESWTGEHAPVDFWRDLLGDISETAPA